MAARTRAAVAASGLVLALAPRAIAQQTPPSYTLTAPVIEGSLNGSQWKQVEASGGVKLSTDDTTVEADTVTGDFETGQILGLGHVRLTRGSDLLEAPEVAYNLLSRSGSLKDGRAKYGIYYVFGRNITIEQVEPREPEQKPQMVVRAEGARATTCNLERPHWAIGASSLTVYPGQNGVAKRVGIFLGGRRLFSIPAYRFSLKRSRQFLPTPGYNEDDGVYLRFNTQFQVPWASASQVAARVSQRNGLSGVVEFQRDIVRPSPAPGDASEEVPERGAMELEPSLWSDFNSINLLEKGFARDPASGRDQYDSGEQESGMRRVLGFVKIGANERVFDPDLRFLYLDRRPEVGLMATAIPVARVAGSPVMFRCQMGYGNFREESEGFWHSRWDARAHAWTQMNILGGLRFRPEVIARIASYSTGDQLRTAAWLLQFGKPLTDNYYGTLTHIRHWSTGSSAFRFDNVDVKEKLAAGLEADWGRTTGRFSAELDLARGGVYDWGFDFARTMHCYRPSISYRHRYRDISASVTFVAATY